MATDRLAVALDAADREIAALVRDGKRQVSCRKGCSACCSEPMYAARGEAQLVLAAMQARGPEAFDAFVVRLQRWLRDFAAAGFESVERPEAIVYRRAALPCPVLADDQTCLVYAHRPYGCRAFLTAGPPEACADLTRRPDQEYLAVDQSAMASGRRALLEALRDVAIAAADAEGGQYCTTDHLGVQLAALLGLVAGPSASAVCFDLVDAAEVAR